MDGPESHGAPAGAAPPGRGLAMFDRLRGGRAPGVTQPTVSIDVDGVSGEAQVIDAPNTCYQQLGSSTCASRAAV